MKGIIVFFMFLTACGGAGPHGPVVNYNNQDINVQLARQERVASEAAAKRAEIAADRAEAAAKKVAVVSDRPPAPREVWAGYNRPQRGLSVEEQLQACIKQAQTRPNPGREEKVCRRQYSL